MHRAGHGRNRSTVGGSAVVMRSKDGAPLRGIVAFVGRAPVTGRVPTDGHPPVPTDKRRTGGQLRRRFAFSCVGTVRNLRRSVLMQPGIFGSSCCLVMAPPPRPLPPYRVCACISKRRPRSIRTSQTLGGAKRYLRQSTSVDATRLQGLSQGYRRFPSIGAVCGWLSLWWELAGLVDVALESSQEAPATVSVPPRARSRAADSAASVSKSFPQRPVVRRARPL